MSAELEHPKLKRFMECETKVIQYADLEHENFQVTEPTIYEIHWDGVKFEFLVCHKPGSKQAAVFGTGDVGNSKTKYQFPIFSRGRWAKELSCSGLWYFDPSVYLGNATLCWYYGTNKRWYLRDIAQIIQTILQKWNISMESTVFSGSSGGGFSSILLAAMLHGKAAVINPQFVATKFHPHLVKRFKDSVLQQGESLIDERLNIISFFIKSNYFPQIYVKQNINATSDIETQLIPLLDELCKLQFNCKERFHVEFYNEEGGHGAQPTKEETINWLDSILAQPLRNMPAVKSTGYYAYNEKLYFYLDTGNKIRTGKDEIVDFASPPAYRFQFQLITDGKVAQSSGWIPYPFYSFSLPKDGNYTIKYFIDNGNHRERYFAKGILIKNGCMPQEMTDSALEFVKKLEQHSEIFDFSRNSKEQKKIIFSIDTESGCGDPYRIHGDLQKYGIEGNWGVSYIMDAFEKRNMHAVFFVNVYEHASYTPEYENYIADLCAEIEARGHEVAIHTHPSLPFYRKSIYDYNLDQQTEIIRYGCEFIKNATGKAPVSFRGGAYRIDENTFLALERNGIKVESSCFYFKQENQKLAHYRSVNQPCRIGNLIEFPVLSVLDNTKESKMDINSLSFEKMREIIECIKQSPGFPFIGIMFHSFSFLDEKGVNRADPLFVVKNRKCYGVRSDIKDRFEQLLDYIAQDDQLEVVTLRDCLEIGIDDVKMENDQIFTIGNATVDALGSKVQVAQKDDLFTFSFTNPSLESQYSWGVYTDTKQLRFETDILENTQFTYRAYPNQSVYVGLFITDSATRKKSSQIVARITAYDGVFTLDPIYHNQLLGESAVALPATTLKLRYRSSEISYTENGASFTFHNDCLTPDTEYAFFVLDEKDTVLEKTPFSTVPSASFSMNRYTGKVKIKAAAKYRGLQTSRIAAEVFCDPENNIYKIDPSYKNPIRTDHS